MATNSDENWNFVGEFRQMVEGLVVLGLILLFFTFFIAGHFLGTMVPG